MKIKFPETFLWGSATAGAQIEGNSDVGGKSPTIWDEWYKIEKERFFDKRNVENDFYNRYKEDIAIASDTLGFNSLRVQIMWSRLLPDGKTINEEAVKFYNNMIDELISKKITPIVTLFHFDMPLWAQKIGGWESQEVLKAFAFFAKTAFELFSEKVKMWVTHNEPVVPVEGGYLYDFHYPNIIDMGRAMRVYYNIIISHHLAVKEFRKLNIKDGKIGIVLSIQNAVPRSSSKDDLEAGKMSDWFHWTGFADPMLNGVFNEEFKQKLEETGFWPADAVKPDHTELIKENGVDFLGVNYYSPGRVKSLSYVPDWNNRVTPATHFYNYYDMPGKRMNPYRGWEIRPRSVYEILMQVKNDYGNLPTYISENGMGVEGEDKWRRKDGIINDQYRIDFIKEHLYWAHKAMEEGANLFGYHMWTYIDNWSWMNAYKNRYGFIELDLDTKERKPKKSAAWIKDVITKSEIDIPEEMV